MFEECRFSTPWCWHFFDVVILRRMISDFEETWSKRCFVLMIHSEPEPEPERRVFTPAALFALFDRIGERFSFQSVTRSDQDSSNQRSWDRHLRIIRGEPQKAVAALLEDDDWLIHVSISVFFFEVSFFLQFLMTMVILGEILGGNFKGGICDS